jgi:hypothetical protein
MLAPVHVENFGRFIGSNQPVSAHFPLSTAQINCSGSNLPFFRKPYIDNLI